MKRRINSPGIELNEIDRSGYDNETDYSTIGTTALILGFAQQGEDYGLRWINSMNTFRSTYGTPTTEAERYFYNAAYEVLNAGGVLTTAKLPYMNNSFENYSYTEYSINEESAIVLSSVGDVLSSKGTCETEECTLKEILGLSRLSSLEKYHDDLSTYSMIYDLTLFVYQQISLPFGDINTYRQIFQNKGVSSILNMQNMFDSDYLDLIKKDKDLSSYADSIESISGRIVSRFGTYSSLIDSFFKTKDIYDISSYLEEICYCGISVDGFDSALSTKYTEVKTADSNITSMVEISGSFQTGTNFLDFSTYDDLLVGRSKPDKNRIMIVDTTRQKFNKDLNQKQYLGIVPVVTSPINAMYYQEIIENKDQTIVEYSAIERMHNALPCFTSSYSQVSVEIDDKLSSMPSIDYDETSAMVSFPGMLKPFNVSYSGDTNSETVSKDACQYFPTMRYSNGHVQTKYLKQIGIVVFRAYQDYGNGGKIGLIPVESFCGSLKRGDRDDVTGEDLFIDNVVNAGSNLINVFSNADFSYYDPENRTVLDRVSTYLVKNQNSTILGLYDIDTKPVINVKKSILDAMTRIFEYAQDTNTIELDLVVDAGVSTIGQFISQTCSKTKGVDATGYYEFDSEKSYLFKINSKEDVQIWKTIIKKFDEFCKYTRKDCMFIADSPRSFCLQGNQKLVRRARISNTVKNTILPKLKFISGAIDSSYSAGYLNWFLQSDVYTGDPMWIPPSIKVLGRYLYTDSNFNYWNAPAGLNRGVVPDVYDVAFNPTREDSDELYTNFWNYAVSYPIDGIVVEGQRTFQENKTALDRVNVRRLMLGLERTARRYAKYFNYEQNTEALRERLVDTFEVYLNDVQNNDGISDFVVICDDRNNTVETIENTELHITVAVKPIKAIEFIIMNFVCTNQSADVEEIAESEM